MNPTTRKQRSPRGHLPTPASWRGALPRALSPPRCPCTEPHPISGDVCYGSRGCLQDDARPPQPDAAQHCAVSRRACTCLPAPWSTLQTARDAMREGCDEKLASAQTCTGHRCHHLLTRHARAVTWPPAAFRCLRSPCHASTPATGWLGGMSRRAHVWTFVGAARVTRREAGGQGDGAIAATTQIKGIRRAGRHDVSAWRGGGAQQRARLGGQACCGARPRGSRATDDTITRAHSRVCMCECVCAAPALWCLEGPIASGTPGAAVQQHALAPNKPALAASPLRIVHLSTL